MAIVPVPAAEPGWQTTEFWVTLAGMVVAFLASAGVITQEAGVRISGLIGMAVAIVGYAVARGIRKSGTPG